MKRSTMWVGFGVSLLLSQQALGADAPAPKGPLSAAEKAQCLVQVTEFNQGVDGYNAQLKELRAMEVEIDALRVEVNAEQRVLNYSDNAAVQALSAKIDKNNGLITRYGQMSSSLKAMGSENKQRAEQFRESCENRLTAVQAASDTPAPDSACSSTSGAKDVESKIEAAFAEMRVDEKQRQAEVERVAQERAKAQSWSADKRGKVWLQILVSPKFTAFEREKQPYVQELMGILGSKPKNPEEECRLVQRIAATLPAIKAINGRQYSYMADAIRVAK